MASPVIVPPAPAAEPLGRKREIEFLSQLVAAVASGEKRAAVLLGPAGVGKTTLLRHCGLLCARHGIAAVSVRAPATAGLPPLFPIGEVVSGLVRSCRQRDLEPPELLLRMEEALRATGDGPAFPIALPQLAEAFEQVGSKTPVAILFDDYHWAPREGSSLLLATLRVIETPALFVATARLRREGEQDTTPLPEPTADLWIDHLQLAGLDATATAELVARELDGPILPSLAAAVYEQTVGNPLFVVEIIRRWREERVIRSMGDYLGLVDETAQAVPGSLQETVSRRLHSLDDARRQVACIMAMLGRDVSFEELRNVLELPTRQLVTQLQHLVSYGVIDDEGTPPAYRLAHPLYAPALLALLGPTGQAALHEAIFEGLRRSTVGNVTEAELAHHAVRALNRPSELRDFISRAAAEAGRVGSYEEAARWYEHLARESEHDLSTKIEALECRAAALAHFDPRTSVEVFSRALALTNDPAQRARQLAGRASAFRILGQFGRSLEDLEEALPTSSDEDRNRIRHQVAVVFGVSGRLREAETILDDLAANDLPVDERAMVLAHLGMAAYSRGLLADALLNFHAAHQLGAQYGSRIHVTQNLIWLQILLGQWIDARASLAAAIAEASQMGDSWYLFSLLTDAARLSAWEGEIPLAFDYCLKARRLIPRLGNPVCEIECLEAIGIVHLEAEKIVEASEVLGQAVDMIRTSSEIREAPFTYALLAEARFRLGDWRSATQILAEARWYLKDCPIWAVAVERVEALCLASSGQATNALESLTHLVERSSALPFEQAKTSLALGEMQMRTRDRESALASFEQALGAFKRLGARGRVAATEARIQTLAARRGRPRSVRQENLTPRELEVLRELTRGETNAEIGRILFISEKTVAKHVENIMTKCESRRRAELIRFAIRHGLIAPDD